MGTKACVSIGVSRPEGLDLLPGAVSAAREMAVWAREAGFEPHLVVDVDDNGQHVEVTTDILRSTFNNVLSGGDVVEHLIVFFAGHGLARNFQDQQWLLTNWRTLDEESVKLSSFVRKLQRYQPERVSIFVDACRNVPDENDDTNEGSGILPRAIDEPREFREDRFQATEFGKSAYMIPVQPATCLFSNVLISALSGSLAGSTETRPDGAYVTSDSLYDSISAAMEAQCQVWNVIQRPSLRPGFLRAANTYAKLPLNFKPPALVQPPPPKARAARRSRPRAGLSLHIPPVAGFTTLFPWSGGGPRSDPLEDAAPADSSTPPATGQGRGSDGSEREIPFGEEVRPQRFETATGMAVNGSLLRRAPIVPPRMKAEAPDAGTHPTWWRFFDVSPGAPPRLPSSLLLELEGGTWIGAAVYAERIVGFSVRDGASVGVIYRPVRRGSEPPEQLAEFDAAERTTEALINRMLKGDLSTQDKFEAAVSVRGMKHVDPTLGAIAAYLYDAVGDRDSIRRMAWFYWSVGQPIPFDVALLADLRGVRDPEGVIRVDIPAVPERTDFKGEGEKEHASFFRRTDRVEAVCVAGGFPWMRQGWSILDDTMLPLDPRLKELSTGLVQAPFTTLGAEAGLRLATLIQAGKV